jgi:indolepyruvate ferredoxin oxidoreductase
MGGIGCHYMATWMDRETDTFTQMGGEGATWIGQAPFTETKHVFQNLGDGTYFHSGLLAIRAAIASGHNITYKILYNDAVAMTGGQPVDGQLSVQQMGHQVRSEGAQRIAVVSDDIDKYNRSEFPADTSFDHRDDLEAVQCELREYTGTSILIFDQTCAAEKRRRRKKGEMVDPLIRPMINTAVCEGCGDCGLASNCLSVIPDETEYGRKRKIEQSSCNKDMSCVKGFCPSFVTVEGGQLRKPEPGHFDADVSDLPIPTLPATDKPYGIVLAGVGGTGVTTLGAILGTAAHLEDKGASVLDMTGLAQKFGAVVTHIQIADDPEQVHAARIAAGGAQLIIGCDLVVAASNDSLVKVENNAAYAIINDHTAMTAEFTRNPDSVFPAQSMRKLVEESVGAQRAHFMNATGAAEQLLGSTMAANILLAGYAWQLGLIPISAEAIAKAIELNGASVKDNLVAFNLGRRLAVNPAFKTTVNQATSELVTRIDTLEAVLVDRRSVLTAYQNVALADRYEALVRKSQASMAEKGISDEALLIKLAQNYFKLLAYKDEYEVARLYSDGTFKALLADQFEGDYKLKFHLAPPLIAPRDKHTGLPRKITFGGWMMPMFSLLAPLRILRGTALDPFGYTLDRRLERQQIKEYEALVEQCVAKLDTRNMATVTALIALPEQIRGFGHIKERSMQRARVAQDALLLQLDAKVEPVKFVDPRAA